MKFNDWIGKPDKMMVNGNRSQYRLQHNKHRKHVFVTHHRQEHNTNLKAVIFNCELRYFPRPATQDFPKYFKNYFINISLSLVHSFSNPDITTLSIKFKYL